MWEEGIILKDEPDTARFGREMYRAAREDPFLHSDCPRVCLLKAGDKSQSGGLSATTGSQQREDFARVHTEANVFNDWGLVSYKPFCNCVYGEELCWHSVFVSLLIDLFLYYMMKSPFCQIIGF